MKIKKYKNYLFHSREELSLELADELILLLQRSPEKPSGTLAGRFGVVLGSLSGMGKVAIKGYRRGGILRFFIRMRYLALGKSRAEQEFEFLERASEIGCSVPRPLISVSHGWPLQRTWLVMEAIESHSTLADISERDVSLLYRVMPQVAENIMKLIEQKIFHVDLHPGNVLIADSGKAYIIDFDKAGTFHKSRSLLRDKYLCRWRRAVIKHELPEVLSELLSAELRRKLDPK